MNEKKYEGENNDTPGEVYQRFPRLISGLKKNCLCKIIKPEDILELKIVPAQRN